MNQSALKTFAQDARNKLRQLIGARLDYVLTTDTAELRQQAAQVNELRAALKNEGRDPLIERVAYTWFNRLAALRFMDANGYHPFGARVITPATANETLPELLQQARAGALDADFKSQIANPKTFDDLLAGRIPVDHPEAQVFKLLLVATCNYYHRLMPFLFEKIGDATELLLPEDLLTEHSIVADFRENLADEDCRDVEVIGWLYQYYVSEKKDAVMARNAPVPTEDIPAVTQLFTPHWIVRYLVENSLGRLWLLNRPHSRLREKMPYYIEGEAETDFLKIVKPEHIRLLDDACGSGHMLTYAFDLLYAIYEEEGYDAPEIPGLILRHNLYGVDICDRAVALAAFALCMKARAKDNRFFRRVVQPNVISLQDVRFDEGDLSAYFKAIGSQPSAINPQLAKLLYQFEEAKNFGSLIQPCLSESEIVAIREKLSTLNSQLSTRDLTVALTHAKVLRVLEQAEYLSQRYHVVVMNPPYLSGGKMNPGLKQFAQDAFNDFKADTFAMFTRRCADFVLENGFCSLITIQGWLYSGSFTSMRKFLIEECSLHQAVQIGYNSFPELNSKYAVAVMFTFTRARGSDRNAVFIDLNSAPTNADKQKLFFERINSEHCYRKSPREFIKLPGYPFAYTVSSKLLALFKELDPLASVGTARSGLQTGDNERFLRFWHEVGKARTTAKYDPEKAVPAKWIFHPKGGFFRRWYGNLEYCVDWESGGTAIINHPSARPQNRDWYFRAGVTWSHTGLYFGARKLLEGLIFNVEAPTFFSAVGDDFILGTLNCSVTTYLFQSIYQSLHFLAGDVMVLPFLKLDAETSTSVETIVRLCIALARADWDNFETSWDFRDLPLLRPGLKGATLAESWQNWKTQCDDTLRRMQELETENNRLFIAAYGLQDELTPEVPEEQITLARADARKDVLAFVSYAASCMFGRYSLDQPGLILADAGATAQDYLARIPQPTFAPDADGILPVLDGEWFQDDIVGRFREFLRVTYGEATLPENLAFIEASLGKELRKYFVREFFKDHLKTYKKRPIYWMFTSPEGSFQALIYLHRYTRDTVNLLLNDYVREFIGKLEERQRQCTAVTLNESARPGDRTKAVKELGKIDKMLKELRAWERDVLLPLAQQRIDLNLDDGVKVNYLKFKGAVVNIPGLDNGEEE